MRYFTIVIVVVCNACKDPVPASYGDECSVEEPGTCVAPTECVARVDTRGDDYGTVCSIPCESHSDCEFQPCNLGCWDDGYCAPWIVCR